MRLKLKESHQNLSTRCLVIICQSEKPKSVKDFVIWAQSETGDDYGDVKVYPIEEDIKIDGPLQRATFWLSVSPEVDPSQIFEPKPVDLDGGANIELGDA